ncbi:MAG TPA: ABC transporter permease [Tissierellales bacterium]|nr:ABC transporter permease [Tissierellales bacterium]
MNRYTWIVFKKEIMDTFRDKKTIISSIIIPIIIFPLIAFFMGLGSSDLMKESTEPVDIGLIYETENSLTEYLSNSEEINIKEVEDIDKALDKLDVKAIVKVDDKIDEKLEKGEKPEVEIIYDDTSQKSNIAFSRISEIISSYSQVIVANRLDKAGIDPEVLNPIAIEGTSVSKEGGEGLMMFAMMLPFMLTIWSAAGGIAAATDLGAGEKERQTLEPLLTTKASRTSILMGKYFTVVVAGVIGTIASLIGFLIASKISPDFMGEGAALPFKSAIVITFVCLQLAFTFASIELSISFYARNFKEAQTYLGPLTIVLMVPAYFTMFTDGRSVPEHYFHIPVMSTIGVIKEVIVSVFNYKHILTTSLWNLTYIVLFLFITVKMFEKEEVVFRN